MHSNNNELVSYGHKLASAIGDVELREVAQVSTALATQLDVTTAALRAMQSERDQLAAQLADVVSENAALKALNEDRRVFIMNGVQLGYIKVPTVETDPALETIRIAVSPQEKTPATDRFLAEQRAVAVEMFAEKCSQKSKQAISSDTRDSWWLCGEHASDFAAQLRNEVKG